MRLASPLLIVLLIGNVFAAEVPAEAPRPEAAAPTVQLGTPEKAPEKAADGGDAPPPLVAPVTTEHQVEISGKKVSYTATAGTLPLTNEDEQATAHVFFVSYSVPSDKPSERPITFCFNGGPGSSSVWLHLGMLGPRRVDLPKEPQHAKPPARVIDNPFSLLDVTDLVFIDPVSTGYSRPLEADKKGQFHGYREDLESVARFIHLYTTKNGRWGSPKYLCGESYGTLRAAALTDHLAERFNMGLNGIILVSTVVDFQTISADATNDLPYILFLPTFAATAWYHGQLDEAWQGRPLNEVVEAAREFATGEYATALLLGDATSPEQREKVVARFAELTGLPARYVRRANLRVSMGRYGKQLLAREEKTVGRFDGRYLGDQRDQLADRAENDPSAAALFPPFTGALYQVLRDDLGIKHDLPYEILTSKVYPWSYESFTNEYVQAVESLSNAMVEQPHLKVFVANGYYDLATPFAAAEYSFNHMNLGRQRENVTFTYYEGGHMMYVHEPALGQLREDLLEFYAR